MKRVFSAIAVVAIVSSALAFAPAKKGGSYCVATSSGGPCSIVHGKTEIPNANGSISRFKNNAWDGQAINCPNTTGSPCTTAVTLYNEL